MGLLERVLRRLLPPYYEPRSERIRRVAFYRQFIEPGDLVFDVGANEGSRTEAFLAIGTRVVAIEPQAECLRILRRRFGRQANLTIEPVALGAADGEITLHLTSLSAIASTSPRFIEATHASGRFANFDYSAQRRVPMTTLDALVERHGAPTFIKIDVEGYESSVLAGMTRHPSSLRALSFEFTPELREDTTDCLQQLAILGATHANYSLGESMALALREWIGLDDMPAALAPFGIETFGDVYVRWGGHRSA